MADESVSDFGIIAWREDGTWSVAQLTDTDELGLIMDQLIERSRQYGGAIALVSVAEDFFIVAREIGTEMKMMISDATFALENDLAVDLLEMLDLPFPEDDDDAQTGGDVDLLTDLGINEMELEAIAADTEMYPDEAIEAIAKRLGFGDKFVDLYENGE
jgi:putative tRNA adenosine deaminase-associated protein